MSYLPWIAFYFPWQLLEEAIHMNPFLVLPTEQKDLGCSTEKLGH